MFRIWNLISFTSLCVHFGCASLPTTVHNPLESKYTVELGPIVSADSLNADESVESQGSKTLNTKEKSGALAFLQVKGGLYAKLDATPIPGMWLGWAKTKKKFQDFVWSPAFESTTTPRRRGLISPYKGVLLGSIGPKKVPVLSCSLG